MKLSDPRIFDNVINFICYNKLSMVNGASGVNILPAPRHVAQEQNQELVRARIQLQLEVEAIVRGHHLTHLTAILFLVVCFN